MTRSNVFADRLAVKNWRAELYLSKGFGADSLLLGLASRGDDLQSDADDRSHATGIVDSTDFSFAKMARHIRLAE